MSDDESAEEYDRRQLATMFEQLDAYEHRQLDLGTLTANLLALHGLQRASTPLLDDAFLGPLGDLEGLYDVAVALGNDLSSEENRAEIAALVDTLRTMITEALGVEGRSVR